MNDWDNLIAKYLADECSEIEKAVLNRWIDADHQNADYFKKMQRVWQSSRLDADNFNPDVASAWNDLSEKIDKKEDVIRMDSSQGPKRWQGLIRAAAVIVLGVGLVFAAYQLYFTEESTSAKVLVHETSQSPQSSELILPDGSVIWLGPNSRIQYPQTFTDESREVFIDGMGFFEITPDPNKPFIIRSSLATTKVLGTSFNLRAYLDDHKVTVTVVSGMVSLSAPNDPLTEIILEKDEKGVYSEQDNRLTKGPNDNPNFMSWRTGKLTFENATLEEALVHLSEYYGTDMVLANNDAGKCRITATFDNQSLEEVLEVLQEIFNGSYQTHGDTRLLNIEGCQ